MYSGFIEFVNKLIPEASVHEFTTDILDNESKLLNFFIRVETFADSLIVQLKKIIETQQQQ